MPKSIPGVLGVLLTLAVVAPTPEASAQLLGRLRRQQSPAQKSRYELDAITSDEHQRLAEMKVELALLSDIATFPYEFAARANGKALRLHGNVPNEMVRQRAMDLARSTTFLRGIDVLTIQPNLSVRSSLLPPDVVQREGMELLHKEIGVAAKQMSLEAHPNGVVVLRGSIDCVESKLEISRLFRHLPGCTAVINELTVEPVLLEGRRMVRVTHNNMLLVPPSALEQGAEPAPAPAPAILPERTPAIDRQPAASPQPQQTAPAPVSLHTSSLKAHDGEWRLPEAVALKQANSPSKLPTEKVGGDWEAFAPSKLPVKWSRPAENWETQAKGLETAHSSPTSSSTQTTRQQEGTSQPSPKPDKLAWTPQAPARPQNKQLQLDPKLSRPSPTVWTRSFPAQNEPTQEKSSSRPNATVKRESPEPAMTWHRPGGNEEAEPKTAPAKTEPRAPAPSSPSPSSEAPVSEKSPPPAIPSLRSSRRWPAAYVTGTPPSKGKSAVISLEDDPPPAKPTPAVIATSRSASASPEDLQRQIKSLCGRQAREVVATVQKDGIVLIRVKVANRSIEDQLSRKILTLPEMSSQRVRLMMEIEP